MCQLIWRLTCKFLLWMRMLWILLALDPSKVLYVALELFATDRFIHLKSTKVFVYALERWVTRQVEPVLHVQACNTQS